MVRADGKWPPFRPNGIDGPRMNLIGGNMQPKVVRFFETEGVSVLLPSRCSGPLRTCWFRLDPKSATCRIGHAPPSP